MRFGLAFFLCAALFAMPAWAQAQQPQSIGDITCPQPIPCPGSAAPQLSSAALIAQANACITQYFGYASQQGFFDEMAGLGGDNCLSPIPGVVPRSVGGQLTPSCCILPRPGTTDGLTCVIHCGLAVSP